MVAPNKLKHPRPYPSAVWGSKPRLRPGRPSKRTPERAAGILGSIAAGRTLADAARDNGITYQTLRDWRKEDRALAEAIEQAQAIAEEARIATIKQAARAAIQTSKMRPTHGQIAESDIAYTREYLTNVGSILYKQRQEDARVRLDNALTNLELKNTVAQLKATLAKAREQARLAGIDVSLDEDDEFVQAASTPPVRYNRG